MRLPFILTQLYMYLTWIPVLTGQKAINLSWICAMCANLIMVLSSPYMYQAIHISGQFLRSYGPHQSRHSNCHLKQSNRGWVFLPSLYRSSSSFLWHYRHRDLWRATEEVDCRDCISWIVPYVIVPPHSLGYLLLHFSDDDEEIARRRVCLAHLCIGFLVDPTRSTSHT